MRQFFILVFIFTCSSILADHDRTAGYNYNGRIFPCEGRNEFRETREFAERHGGGAWYNHAFCQLHRGPDFLLAGIATLKSIADEFPLAAVEVAEYYSSEGYKLPKGTVTDSEANLLKAIEYEEKALNFMSSPDNNYPFNDNDNFIFEQGKSSPYLRTSANLLASYMALFTVRSIAHIESIGGYLEVDTLNPLKKVIEAAGRCLAIPYDERLWKRGEYNKMRSRCTENQRAAEVLLPLERKRLRVARTHCQGKRLFSCEAHNIVDREIERIYNDHVDRADRLLASL